MSPDSYYGVAIYANGDNIQIKTSGETTNIFESFVFDNGSLMHMNLIPIVRMNLSSDISTQVSTIDSFIRPHHY